MMTNKRTSGEMIVAGARADGGDEEEEAAQFNYANYEKKFSGKTELLVLLLINCLPCFELC
jgi:hypothetical protein